MVRFTMSDQQITSEAVVPTWAYRSRLPWLLLLLLALFGCTSQTVPTPTSPPTVQSVQAPATISRDGNLTALRANVWRIRDGEQVEIERLHALEIREGDQITLSDQGHGLLRFREDLVLELFRETQLEVLEAKHDTNGFLVFSFRLGAGSVHIELNAQRDTRLELQTDLTTGTVTAAGGEGAEFTICYTPETAACLATVRGAVEVVVDDRSVTVPAGEAVYLLANMPLGDPICVVQDELVAWLEMARSGEQNRELHAVMSEWPQLGCDDVAAATATPPQPTAPSAENMVRVEGGLYEIGSRNADNFHVTARDIEVASYWIDLYEVTNEQYGAFVDATGHAPPAGWPFASGREQYPVQGVTWDASNAYCQWRLKRLPTEAEWEIAGRGAGDPPPTYPWGDDPFANGAVDTLPFNETYPVGSAEFTASSLGVYDLVGNVWEWVGEPYDQLEEGLRMLRGGRHGFHRDLAFRQPAGPAEASLLPFAGFRCATNQVEGE